MNTYKVVGRRGDKKEDRGYYMLKLRAKSANLSKLE
jgi:hypothetical protein